MNVKIGCILYLFVGIAPPVVANENNTPKEQHIVLGECTRPRPGKDLEPRVIAWPATCIEARAGVQSQTRTNTSKQDTTLTYFDYYQGIHLNSHVALHGKFWGSRQYYEHLENRKSRVKDELSTKHLFLQLGNPSTDRWRLMGGKIEPAFGIHAQVLPEIYDATIRSERYWTKPRLGLRLTFDSQVSVVYEVSVHNDHLSYNDQHFDFNGENQPDEGSVAARVMFDIAALDGFRFVFSVYGNQFGERRVSGGCINTTSRGDTTTFEWVRLATTPKLRTPPYQQNFRLNFQSAFRSSSRWIIEYESDSDAYRMGTVGFDVKAQEHILLRFAGSLHNGWNPSHDRFALLTGGIEVNL